MLPMSTPSPQARFLVAELGSLLSDPARAAILLALKDGTVRPAGELARMAGIAPSTASAHLRKLIEGELLSVVECGRHRYYRLANERVAHMLENLSVSGVSMLRSCPWRGDPIMLRARTCYDHLAGRLGVALFEQIRAGVGWELSEDAVRLSQAGAARLRGVGLLGDDDVLDDVPGHTCVDWSERRFHLGGKLGAWLTSRLFDKDWIRRRSTTRALTATSVGREGLRALGVEWEALGD
jgi:DNA-binding transcriptional ArsR family regulator